MECSDFPLSLNHYRTLWQLNKFPGPLLVEVILNSKFLFFETRNSDVVLCSKSMWKSSFLTQISNS